MGVYIKGMEMPTRCSDCWLMNTEDSWCCACRGKPISSEYKYGIKDRPDWCPIIELPPHGRLIDADALCSAIENEIDECRWDNASFSGYRVWDLVEDAPTIIPAEGKEE